MVHLTLTHRSELEGSHYAGRAPGHTSPVTWALQHYNVPDLKSGRREAGYGLSHKLCPSGSSFCRQTCSAVQQDQGTVDVRSKLWNCQGKGQETHSKAETTVFWKRTPVAQDLIPGTDKWDCVKLKGFCTAKETISINQQEDTEKEGKTLTTLHHMGLTLRIYQEQQIILADHWSRI